MQSMFKKRVSADLSAGASSAPLKSGSEKTVSAAKTPASPQAPGIAGNSAAPASAASAAASPAKEGAAVATDAPHELVSNVTLKGPGMLLVRVVEARGLLHPNGSALVSSPTDKLPYVVIEFDKNEILAAAKDFVATGGLVGWQHRAHFDVSRVSEVVISVYQRGESQDMLVGTTRLTPSFKVDDVQDMWCPLLSMSEGPNAGASVGEVHVQMCFREQSNKPMTIDEFELLKVIGKGSFGKVMQVRKRDTNRIYAMKILRKSHIVERSEVAHTLAERTVLAQILHPFIVPLKFSFQTSEKLYLVLAFVNGGELFHHLQREGRFHEDRARFYSAELLCALDCLHGYNIVYRDLKPENILIDYTGHIALCDFGLCKLNMKEGNKTNTFCGTPEYLAPELLLGQGYTKVVDWWTLGILLWEMLTGLPPFYDENTNEMYRKILSDELVFSPEVSPTAKDLLSRLLQRDPKKRLGNNGADEIKKHPFFAEIDWKKLMARKYQPPFKPNVQSATDTSNFDEEFTSEVPQDSLPDTSHHLSETMQQQFAGFTYQAPAALAGSMAQANGGSLVAGSRMGGGSSSSLRTLGPSTMRPVAREGHA